MDITKLRPHPWNHRIYSAQDLSELEHSLTTFGQLEPLAITPDNQIISGHRRFAAMTNLGWTDVDVRIIEPTSPLLSLVEHNRHRTKTASDLLNEAQILKEHLKSLKGTRLTVEENQGRRRTPAVHEVAANMDIGHTSLKRLMSIRKYDPALIKKIDNKEISIGAAYQAVREKYILPKRNSTKSASKVVSDTFNRGFKKLLAQEKPTLDEIKDILRETYPYCLEMTGIDEDQRLDLKNCQKKKNKD